MPNAKCGSIILWHGWIVHLLTVEEKASKNFKNGKSKTKTNSSKNTHKDMNMKAEKKNGSNRKTKRIKIAERKERQTAKYRNREEMRCTKSLIKHFKSKLSAYFSVLLEIKQICAVRGNECLLHVSPRVPATAGPTAFAHRYLCSIHRKYDTLSTSFHIHYYTRSWATFIYLPTPQSLSLTVRSILMLSLILLWILHVTSFENVSPPK